MPTVRKGESQSDYLARCIPMVKKEGKAKNSKHAVAMCAGMYRQGRKRVRNVRHRYQQFAVNWDFASARKETLAGKPHWVVPMIMMVEGVHAGSQGPVLYTANELKRTVRSWNHRPIVLNHPKVNGRYVSACSAKVLDEYSLGLVLNAKFDDKKKGQSAEAWLDDALLKAKAPNILNAIQSNQKVPLSTGLYTDVELGAGRWNGQEYIGVTANHVPDHLALLINEEGACSTDKGCGLLVNNETVPDKEPKMAKSKKEWTDEIIANKDLDWGEDERDALMNMSEKRLETIATAKAPAPVTNTQKQPEPPATQTQQQPACGCQNQQQGAPVANQQPVPVLNLNGGKKLTVEEYLKKDDVPDDVKELLTNQLRQQKVEKDRLIGVILSNSRNGFTKEWLETQAIDVLQGMAQIAQPQEANRQPTIYVPGAPIMNTKPAMEVAPLESPTLNSLFPSKQTAGAGAA